MLSINLLKRLLEIIKDNFIEISNGQLYSEDLPLGTFSDETTQEVKLFVTDEEGNFDFERVKVFLKWL